MKLRSVKILGGDFKSLTVNKEYKFNVPERDDRLSTKCFTGLNGSGKSNMLELLAEIFYFLDYHHLEHGDPDRKKGKGVGFEIQYLLPFSDFDRNLIWGKSLKSKWMHIRVHKPLGEDDELEFSVKPWNLDNTAFIRKDKGTELLLPKKIVAYTSGQNEMLSNPFYKLKYHYFRENLELKSDHEVNDRMFFIDKANNFNVFISNLLLSDPIKVNRLQEVYKIKGLHSFRITINGYDHANKVIPFSKEVLEIIEELRSCATTWDITKLYKSKSRVQHVFDFLVDDAMKDAFSFHFDGSAMNLFTALYQLEMLNIYQQKPKVKSLVHNAPEWLNISDEIPEIEPDEQIFRIEKILIDKIISDDKVIPISYKHLSDGEHQFNEVIGSMMLMEEEGCLLLFDEPDTHFNPMWRAKLIELLNGMAASEYDSKKNVIKVRNQEVILTTHSPFAISDSYQQDVYIFKREHEIFSIDNPDIKTYGASVGMILENIFDRDKSISDLASSDLDKIKMKTRNLNKVQEAKEDLLEFGESIEKFDAINYLFEKEDEIKLNAKKKLKTKVKIKVKAKRKK
jgi:restriction system-associated AAA family ATPase